MTENPFKGPKIPYALDGLVPPAVAEATDTVQGILEDELNCVIDIDWRDTTGLVIILKNHDQVSKTDIENALTAYDWKGVAVSYDENTQFVTISSLVKSLH